MLRLRRERDAAQHAGTLCGGCNPHAGRCWVPGQVLEARERRRLKSLTIEARDGDRDGHRRVVPRLAQVADQVHHVLLVRIGAADPAALPRTLPASGRLLHASIERGDAWMRTSFHPWSQPKPTIFVDRPLNSADGVPRGVRWAGLAEQGAAGRCCNSRKTLVRLSGARTFATY